MSKPEHISLFCFIFLLHTTTIQSKVLDGLQLSYSPGIVRITTQNNSETGGGLIPCFQQRLSFRLNIRSTGVKWYTGAHYISENVWDNINLFEDPRGSKKWVSGYSDYCLGFPLGAKIKLNNKEVKFTYLTIELAFGLYGRERYTYNALITALNYGSNVTITEYTVIKFREEYSGLVRYLLSFGIERETPLSERVSLVRGITISPGIRTINRNTVTNFKSSSLNAFIGICFR